MAAYAFAMSSKRARRSTPLELDAAPRVSLHMVPRNANVPSLPSPTGETPRVRTPLLVALGVSIALHVAWTFWPVDVPPDDDSTVLQATLTQLPPPPPPTAEPPVPSQPSAKPPQKRAPKPSPTPIASKQAAPSAPVVDEATAANSQPSAPSSSGVAEIATPPAAASNGSVLSEAEPALSVELPPRVDLVYKVFLGTQGFVIGDATYRFEHEGDRYRISTVGQARGLAALIVRGTGKVESRGRITNEGLRPYEFAVERGSADRREIAYFDWDAGNVVLQDGARAQLEAPTFDPLTILWQPYFSPPSKGDQSFSLATTRRVTRYTLTLQGEEMVRWPHGEIATERWHRRSDDGNTDAWFWLAPSLHYLPIKMRVTRTSRGTLEVVLDSIRVDEAAKFGLPAELANEARAPSETTQTPTHTSSDIEYGMPGTGMPMMRAEDLHGQ